MLVRLLSGPTEVCPFRGALTTDSAPGAPCRTLAHRGTPALCAGRRHPLAVSCSVVSVTTPCMLIKWSYLWQRSAFLVALAGGGVA